MIKTECKVYSAPSAEVYSVDCGSSLCAGINSGYSNSGNAGQDGGVNEMGDLG